MASIAERAAVRRGTLATDTKAADPDVMRHVAVPASHVAWGAVAAVAIAAGIYLRTTQLAIQILLDDEWHAIHELLHANARAILTSFGVADFSIPLTLYYRFLALHGGLSEWEMHVPMLIAGVALLALGPLLLRRQAPLAVLATWTMLLAISPLLVYLDRTARPYALTCLLAFVAIVALRNGWRRGPHANAWAATYAIATFLAGWLHLVTLAFTLLPLGYYALRALATRHGANRVHALRRLALLGAATAIPLAAALVPPLLASAGQLAQKVASDSVTPESAYRTALMLFGTGSPWVLALCVPLGIAGAHRMWRRDADFAGCIAFACIGSALAVAAARPQWIQHPLVYARYMLPALPFLLLVTAEGAVAAAERLPRVLAAPIVVLGGAVLFAAGPIPGYLHSPNQFMGHQRFQFDYDPAHNPYVYLMPPDPIPAFYRELAMLPPRSLTLVEAPWSLVSNFDPHFLYQQVHRQYVKIGLVTPVCGPRDFGEYPPGTRLLRFREFVHLTDILAGRAQGADYLVMNVKPWKIPPDAALDWPDVAACLPAIAARLGAPVYRDDAIVVFDLRGARGS